MDSKMVVVKAALLIGTAGMVSASVMANSKIDSLASNKESESSYNKIHVNEVSKTDEDVVEDETEVDRNVDEDDTSLMNISSVQNNSKSQVRNENDIMIVGRRTADSKEDCFGMVNIEKEQIIESKVVGTDDVLYCTASFYDYYSDSQVTSSSIPGKITDAEDDGRYGHFNRRILELMQYGNTKKNPAKYPLYLGNFFAHSNGPDYDGIYYKDNESANAISNLWFGANRGVYGYAVTQGLVDDKLYYDADGVSHLMTSNPANGKSAEMALFNKDLLTNNKIKSSGTRLALADVKEEVKFPLKKTKRNGITYYGFDSREDVVRFNKNDQLDFYTGNIDRYIAYDRHDGVSFLPYNNAGDPHSAVNYCFGMKLEIPFYMTPDGKINGKDLEFNFSGDDDVWIFVDGELVLDLGGCHRRMYGTINFNKQTGVVEAVCNPKVVFSRRVITIPGDTTHYTDASVGVYNQPIAYYNVKKNFSNTLKEKFDEVGAKHVITVFYMERAKGASNLEISFNLLAIDEHTRYEGEYHLFELH